MAYHEGFWVAVTTAGPVLMLAHVVAANRHSAAFAVIVDQLKALADARRNELDEVVREVNEAQARNEIERIPELKQRIDELRLAVERTHRAASDGDAAMSRINVMSTVAAVSAMLCSLAFAIGLTSLATDKDLWIRAAGPLIELPMVALFAQGALGASVRIRLRRNGLAIPELA